MGHLTKRVLWLVCFSILGAVLVLSEGFFSAPISGIIWCGIYAISTGFFLDADL